MHHLLDDLPGGPTAAVLLRVVPDVAGRDVSLRGRPALADGARSA